MEKIYKPKYTLTNKYIYILFGILALAIWLIAGFLDTRQKGDIWILFFMGAMFLFFEFVFIVESKVRVSINDVGIYYKRLDKKVKIKWDEIKKIEKVWRGYAGICYYIVTKKGKLHIPSTLDYEDLFKEIENRTGRKIKWGL